MNTVSCCRCFPENVYGTDFQPGKNAGPNFTTICLRL